MATAPASHARQNWLRLKLRHALQDLTIPELQKYEVEVIAAVKDVIAKKQAAEAKEEAAAKIRERTRSHIRASSCDDDEE